MRKRFGKTEIIRGVSTSTSRRGERLAIIGPNGAGKSTLFNLISGRFAPTRGAILLNGEDIAGTARLSQINRLGLARSFQITNIFPRLSVLREPALRRALVAGLPLHLLAFLGRAARRQRARRRRCWS